MPRPHVLAAVVLALPLLLSAARAGAACTPGPDRLCLLGGRFQVTLEAMAPEGPVAGRALPATDKGGAFWLFDEGNVEMVVKMHDGGAWNGAFWLFSSSLTTLDYDMTVFDTATGATRLYRQRQGRIAGTYDLDAFPSGSAPAVASGRAARVAARAEAFAGPGRRLLVVPSPAGERRVAATPEAGPPVPAPSPANAPACAPGPRTLCLAGGRFRVEADWYDRHPGSAAAPASAVAVTDTTGLFAFFDPALPEVAVKALDGRGTDGAFWVFATPLTTLAYDLRVTDTGSGRARVYEHPAEDLAGLVDVASFRESPLPPLAPLVIEPDVDGRVISAFDVHMETAPAVDPDGDGHFCSDFEIWRVAGSPPALDERVWSARCVIGQEKLHIHLGDGEWEGSRVGLGFLELDAPHVLRVRFRDGTGAWGPYAERSFVSAVVLRIYPLELAAVAPGPVWAGPDGAPVVLPGAATSLRLESAAGDLLAAWHGPGGGGGGGVEIPGGALPAAAPVRLALAHGGPGTLRLPASEISLADAVTARRATIYLPPVDLAPGQQRLWWVSANGSTFVAEPGDTAPDFSTLAFHTPRPWAARRPGIVVERVAGGLQLPVSLAFPVATGSGPSDPLLYVTELYGRIALVRRDGAVEDFATGLLDFDPTGNFPGSGEIGLAGLAVDPATGDLFASVVYQVDPDEPAAGHSARVLRLGVDEAGRHDGVVETVLDIFPDLTAASHQISQLSFGPDGKLYVHVADGLQPARAHDLDSFLGKILRLERDGSAPPDNPFYDPDDGIGAADFVHAFGFRNPFGGAWRGSDGALYEVENGPRVDRLARVLPGVSYGWDADRDGIGTDEDMRLHAIATWGPPSHAPVGLAFLQPGSFAGSGFPPQLQDLALVTEFGQALVPGVISTGKRVVAIGLGADGGLVAGPETWVEYEGHARTSVSGIAVGPDGVYFAEIFSPHPEVLDPTSADSRLWRIRWVGEGAE